MAVRPRGAHIRSAIARGRRLFAARRVRHAPHVTRRPRPPVTGAGRRR
ncbi:hypothetical protein BMA721280_L0175 [Burkholderia mallei 2002721280]|nr:hypothetical protein BMAFMH_E0431 [Burkholderia mallei FMH]EDK84054.1 hypothetical protein BMA721280_L0175 [Burkholderia mallei 2002721280]EDO93441.1 hypothetical protein BURPSPAST_J0712 [Burkholderia pseudomallei Pasteur 52237]EDS82407.1 hypothetical protein BURPSS13_T0485 [Burkholderia pseudomallei S13]